MIKMKKKTYNIETVVKNNLCTGCGICENICGGAISIQLIEGKYVPQVDNNKCVMCGLCYTVCGGEVIKLQSRAKELFSDKNIKEDYYIGRYISTYSGYSNSYNIRFHSASGGIVSQFLIYLLEKKIIQGAVVVGFNTNNITEPDVYIAKTKEDVLSAKSSKYCPVSYHGVVEKIMKTEGKLVVVGLPCHIHSLRKYESAKNEFRKKILGYFAIYCSGTKTMLSQNYLFNKYGIEKNNLKTFSYRDDGCMGFLKAVSKDNKTTKVPYREYWHSMRGFFSQYRCTLCIDHYGELADISIGDIHVGEYINDEVGVNSIISRNNYFDNLLQLASNEGYITIDKISAEIINDSQVYAKFYKKGSGVKIAFLFRKLLKKRNPEYDTRINARISIKYVIRHIVHVIERYIGRERHLWFLIEYLDLIAIFFNLGIKRENRK